MRPVRITSAGQSPRHGWATRCSGLVIVVALLGGPGAGRAAERDVPVTLDRAQLLAYPPQTETIIVGNPIIADVTMLKNAGQVILTGKGYGDTNLVFLDGHGAILSEVHLKVRGSSSTLVVQRGAERETYACQPRCQPTVSLGDSSTYLQRVITDIQARNSLATGAAASSAVQPH